MAGSGRAEEGHASSYQYWWWRLGPRNRRAMILGLVVAALFGYGPVLVRPLVRSYVAADQVLQLEAERDAAATEGGTLAWRLQQAATPEGQRQEGKALKLVPKGERMMDLESGAVEAALRGRPVPKTGLGATFDEARTVGAAKARHFTGVLQRLVRDPASAAAAPTQ